MSQLEYGKIKVFHALTTIFFLICLKTSHILQKQKAMNESSISTNLALETSAVPIKFDEFMSNLSSTKYIYDVACGLDTIFYLSSDNHYGNFVGRRLYNKTQEIRKNSDYDDSKVRVRKRVFDYESICDITHACIHILQY